MKLPEILMLKNKIGKFITFEGADGVGKSTQVQLLSNQLKNEGYSVYVTREPGGTILAENIRQILKEQITLDPITEILLIFAARRSHFVDVIKPMLSKGYIVISDRFYDSSLVYQGILKEVSIEKIMTLKYMVMEDFEPDLTFILDMPAETAHLRTSLRHDKNTDIYDDMSIDSYNRVRNGFLKIAQIFSSRAIVINASGRQEIVLKKILKSLKEFMAKW